MKIGFKATQIAIAGFIIPYIAVYDNALMVQGDPTVWAVLYVVVKCLLAIALWGGMVVGYLFGPLQTFERVVAFSAAAMLVAAAPMTDEIGFAMSAAFIAWHLYRVRGSRAAHVPAPVD